MSYLARHDAVSLSRGLVLASHLAAPHSSTSSAPVSLIAGSPSRRRHSQVVSANGGLATTWNGRRGSGTRRRSPSTTATSGSSANRRRSRPASAESSSTAITRAPVPASGAVSAPYPAPRSKTRSPSPTALDLTSCPISRWSLRKCAPGGFGRSCRVRHGRPDCRPATDEHDHAHGHSQAQAVC